MINKYLKVYLGAGIISLFSLNGYAQGDGGKVDVRTLADDNRAPVVMASLDLSELHQQLFLPIYERYEKKHEETFGYDPIALKAVAHSDDTPATGEAFNYINDLIHYGYDALNVKQEYFEEISQHINGLVAFQFLQTEALIDLMSSAERYEKSAGYKPMLDYTVLTSDDDKKRQILTSILSLPASAAEKFQDLCNAYEHEYTALWGQELSAFQQYITEESDLTPAQGKRLGREFLTLQRKENKLKEKYFLESHRLMGPSLAARFIALEDYWSILAKMKAWQEK